MPRIASTEVAGREADRNAGYSQGLGLVTLVPLSLANIAHLFRAVAENKLRQPVDAVRALARRLPGSARLLRSEVVRQRSRSERYPTAGEAADALRGGLGSSFGADKAADELAKIAEEGADRLAEFEVPRPEAAGSA